MKLLASVRRQIRVGRRQPSPKTPAAIRTVLVVDGNPDDLAATCRAIGKQYPVLSARSGEDALRVAHNTHPSIVVLDVAMTGKRDGYSIFRDLQLDPLTRDIPVLFLTNIHKVTGLTLECFEVENHLGKQPAGILEKPVSAELLLSSTARVLNIYNASAQQPQTYQNP